MVCSCFREDVRLRNILVYVGLWVLIVLNLSFFFIVIGFCHRIAKCGVCWVFNIGKFGVKT